MNATVTHKNRNYEIVEMTDINKYLNIAKANSEITHTFIAQGKRGALISGYMYKNNKYVTFDN